jgi:CRP-like cAMP-binding protein
MAKCWVPINLRHGQQSVTWPGGQVSKNEIKLIQQSHGLLDVHRRCLMVERTAFLARIPIFSHMQERDLQRMADQAKELHFQKGDLIIREGEKDHQLFVILSGEAEVVKDFGRKTEKRIRSLGPHTYFGEMALIDDLVRSATIIAKKDTHVLSIDRLDLHAEIRKYPEIAIELLQMLSRRIRAIEMTMINTLGSFLPICSNCKKIRKADGSWQSVENYIADHSETEFSHGICPQCMERLYPGVAEHMKSDKGEGG